MAFFKQAQDLNNVKNVIFKVETIFWMLGFILTDLAFADVNEVKYVHKSLHVNLS